MRTVNSALNILSPSSLAPVFFAMFYYLLFINLFSNVPFSSSPVLYYFYTISISLTFWVALIVVVYRTQLRAFIAHLLPYGAPMFLAVLLPIIELFSQLIRPLTLIIRLSTNLSAGHIILYMFSYFSLSSTILFLRIFILLAALIVLEFCISLLQAYIFTSLSYIYVRETI
jgi:F-type H+-transporting ATPase subunit a